MQGKKKLSYEELEQVSDANYEAWQVAKADAEFLRGLLNMLDVFLDRAGVEKDNEICERIGFLVNELGFLDDERHELRVQLEAARQMIAFMKKSVQEHFEQLDGDDVPMFCFSDGVEE